MSRLKAALVIGSVVVATAACSSTKSSHDHGTPPGSLNRVQASTPAAVTSPSKAAVGVAAGSRSAPAASALSGTWHGRYGGSYSGTFVLTWHQSGADLSGTIALSDPAGTVPIHGSVAGGRIEFGTVGSYAVTYTGSVSGDSMSGSYEAAGAAAGSGTWTATKG
jgi:hypothetical protein